MFSLRLMTVALAAAPAAYAFAQNCAGTTTGRTPLVDMGPAALYLGQFEGGLYPGPAGTMPADHLAAGMASAAAVVPRNLSGQPDPAGKVVMISVGMSNTTQEFCSGNNNNCAPHSFIGQAAAHNDVNHTTLVILDGARGGQPAQAWTNPASPNYQRILDDILTPRGLGELQVQVAWVKQANPQPAQSLPDAQADAYRLLQHAGDIARALKTRYPNMQQVYFSTRIYAGYATTTLNPEPYAYENGFSIKWLVESQIRQQAGMPLPHPFGIPGNLLYDGPAAPAPWIAWGPYLWADGLTPRADGLIWECSDFTSDGTHPAFGARQKVGAMLLTFLLSSPTSAAWFRADQNACYADCNADHALDINDFLCFIDRFAQALTLPQHQQITHAANCTRALADPILSVDDFLCFIDAFAGGCP